MLIHNDFYGKGTHLNCFWMHTIVYKAMSQLSEWWPGGT